MIQWAQIVVCKVSCSSLGTPCDHNGPADRGVAQQLTRQLRRGGEGGGI
jgi:hypothetical protein